jgi:serine/threonine protein kinase/Tol biopolymer transport system component
MSLTNGARLGAYEVIGRLGAGAMGEVYRARDTRLGRDVALKILPLEFAENADRRRRFEQEARAASALNHPNIVSVYDAGSEDGAFYMVCELVEGESLRDLIRRGPLPLRRALDLGAQIADGLGVAHAAGIVHRDLKPENVMLTRDGRAKILDFGLARYEPVTSHGAQAGTQAATQVTMTQPGTIMGTVGYMSPEQVTGATADARSDVFSLGIILYEMLTGRAAFEEASSVETMSAILRKDPPELPDTIPPALRQVVSHCLEKEPSRRFQSASDLAFALRSYPAASGSTIAMVPGVVLKKRLRLLPIATGVLAFICALAIAAVLTRPRGADLAAYRFTPFATESEIQSSSVWSPDGKSVAYVREIIGAANEILVRSLDSLVPVPVARADAQSISWSADGTRLYYVNAGEVLSVSRAGGPQQQVVKGTYNAAALSPDSKSMVLWLIYNDRKQKEAKIWISSPPGATPRKYEPAIFEMQGSYSPVYLRFSPDGRQILLALTRGTGPEMWLLPFPDGPGANGKPKRIFASKLAGDAAPPTFSWMPDSRHIVMALSLAEHREPQLWMADINDESMEPITADEGRKAAPSVSPDGKKIVYTAEIQNFDLVQIPVAGGPVQPLLTTSRNEYFAAWSPNQQQFAYATDRNGPVEIWLKSNQENWERPLVTARDFPDDQTTALLTLSFSPDGRRLAYSRNSSTHLGRIWISPVGGGTPIRLTESKGFEISPAWSPDGNWISYLSSDGGLMKIRVGGNDAPVALKSDGCENAPQWSPGGEWITCAGKTGVDLLTPAGKRERTIGSRPASAAWSHDGKDIYTLARTNGSWKLAVIDVASGKEKTISDLGSTYLFIAPYMGNGSLSLSLSPDGKTLATSVLNYKRDIWMLEGFRAPGGFLSWPWFGR